MKIPKVLIYNYPNSGDYRMINIAEKKIVGKMSVDEKLDLFISDLEIVKSEQGKGYGKMFIEFARKLSELKGLGGRLRALVGAKISSENNPPHIFYRKMGFTTNDEGMLKKIDNCIKNNVPLKLQDTKIVYMYYPETML